MSKPAFPLLGHAAFTPNPPPAKLPVGGFVKVNAFAVVERAVEDGIACGLRRADKHADDPLTDAQRERLTENLEREVLASLDQWLKFE